MAEGRFPLAIKPITCSSGTAVGLICRRDACLFDLSFLCDGRRWHWLRADQRYKRSPHKQVTAVQPIYVLVSTEFPICVVAVVQRTSNALFPVSLHMACLTSSEPAGEIAESMYHKNLPQPL
jgi:hypothetical protein